MTKSNTIDDIVGPALGIAGTIFTAGGVMAAYHAYRSTPDLFLEQPEHYIAHSAPIVIGLMLIYHAFKYANKTTASSDDQPSNHDTTA